MGAGPSKRKSPTTHPYHVVQNPPQIGFPTTNLDGKLTLEFKAKEFERISKDRQYLSEWGTAAGLYVRSMGVLPNELVVYILEYSRRLWLLPKNQKDLTQIEQSLYTAGINAYDSNAKTRFYLYSEMVDLGIVTRDYSVTDRTEWSFQLSLSQSDFRNINLRGKIRLSPVTYDEISLKQVVRLYRQGERAYIVERRLGLAFQVIPLIGFLFDHVYTKLTLK